MSKFKITFEDVECELIGNEVKMINPWLVYCDNRVVEFVKPIKNIEKMRNDLK